MSPNEKYYRLMAGQPLDECLHRTALRNLALVADGLDLELLNQFKLPPPNIPPVVIEWFKQNRNSLM